MSLIRCSTLWKALFIAYGGPYAVAAALKVLQDLLAFLQPQLLRLLLSYISVYQSTRLVPDRKPSDLEGFALALIMFIASVIQTICLNQVCRFLLASFEWYLTFCIQYFQRTFETGYVVLPILFHSDNMLHRMRVRAGLVTAIYQKALVLSNDERTRGSGDIVNLMSVDATRLQDLCTYGLIAISGPLQVSSSLSERFFSDLSLDYTCLHLAVRFARVGSLRRCGYHGFLNPTEHTWASSFCLWTFSLPALQSSLESSNVCKSNKWKIAINELA